jgi:N-terminal domain on NACHT_NTPase and P-loop NTPases
MAEVIGIIASAIAFAQATAAVLDAMNKIKDAPKSIRELQHELRDLEAVLRQIDSTSSSQKGEPTVTVLRSCSDMLKRLRDLIAPFRQEAEENKFKQYVKGLRIRSIEGEIESAVKQLQSQKLTLTLAFIASVHRSDSLSYPSRMTILTITYRRHEMLQAHSRDMAREPGDVGAKGWDMKMLIRIIDQRMAAVTQQLCRDPTSKIEDLLDLDKAQTDELWRLDFESVRNLKGRRPLSRKFSIHFHQHVPMS